MLLGLLFLGLVPAAFMAEGFFEDSNEVEPDEAQPTSDAPPAENGDFIAGNDAVKAGGSDAQAGSDDNSGTEGGTEDGAKDGGEADKSPAKITDTPDKAAGVDDGASEDTDDTNDNDTNTGDEEEGDPLDPIDQPGEGIPSGPDATLLDKLLAENTDAVYGLKDYDNVAKDADPLLLGDGDDTHVGSSDGNKADGALKLFNGTPFIDLQEDGLVGVIDGQGGDDTITTGDDASFAFGGEGDDKIIVGAAPAAVFGGEGDDEIIGAYTANEDENSGYLDGGLGNDNITGGEGIDLIFGGQHDDNGAGPDNDTLDGGEGNDKVSGGYGADLVKGGAGDDVINHLGHAMENSGAERSSFDWHIDGDADTLDGGEGNDKIIMDRADVATGGSGADNFQIYSDQGDGLGHATVTDFASGEDFLRITLDPDEDEDSVVLDVSPSENGADGVVTVNGEVVAILQGAPNATAADVRVEVMEEVYA